MYWIFKEAITGPIKFKMAQIGIFKMVKSPYLNEETYEFDEIRHKHHIWYSMIVM